MQSAGEDLCDDLYTEVPKPTAASPHLFASPADRENRGTFLGGCRYES
jgi:hypothetical protein